MLKKIISLAFFFQITVFGQDYYQVTGQTVPFELKAGNKAAWDHNAQGVFISKKGPALPYQIAIVNVMGGKTLELRVICGRLPGPGRLSVFNIQGMKIYVGEFRENQRSLVLNKPLPNGQYFAQLSIKGKAIATTRFLVAR